MAENLCYNCFAERPGGLGGPCPRCGYDNADSAAQMPRALRAGSLLNGQYLIGRVLGRGGFGAVYLAMDRRLNVRVAVRESPPDGVERFQEEARVLARFIGNRNIAGVKGYFRDNGTAYSVMDYAEGISFQTYIRNKGGRLGWEDAMRVMIPVLRALSALHREGFVHSGVTPDNIYITKGGEVKLLAFGSARCGLGDRSPDARPEAQYIWPGGQSIFADVYAAAACFYAAVTGIQPPESLQRANDDGLVSPSAQGVAIPTWLDNAVMTGLAVRAEDRYQNAGEFLAAIEAGRQTVNHGPLPVVAAAPAITQSMAFQAPPQPAPQSSIPPPPVLVYTPPAQPWRAEGVEPYDIPPPPQPKKKRGKLPLLIAALALAVVLIGVGVFLLTHWNIGDMWIIYPDKASDGYTYSDTECTLVRGKSVTLDYGLKPIPHLNDEAAWRSDDAGVITVSDSGKVTAVGPGTATVWLEAAKVKVGQKFTVTAPAERIELGFAGAELAVDDTASLRASVSPKDTTDTLTYESSSDAIATVDASGVIHAKSAGTVTITAVCGAIRESVTLEVYVPVTDIELNVTSVVLEYGKQFQLQATVLPEGARTGEITYSLSGMGTGATVSSDGLITARAYDFMDNDLYRGTVTVRAGDVEKEIPLTVQNTYAMDWTEDVIDKPDGWSGRAMVFANTASGCTGFDISIYADDGSEPLNASAWNSDWLIYVYKAGSGWQQVGTVFFGEADSWSDTVTISFAAMDITMITFIPPIGSEGSYSAQYDITHLQYSDAA